ncbi:hypothetical protein M406DRAFT_291160 [Cryphonectria parasitica EP155]|uniref:Calcineurin-like phosphoesterase domain-containing protein n=1 Tax=Cryphonectria parasitica (strain ATCC 38755 / EP155) TaxID=660469 RepID=A0A9P5CMH9_CRYP1|nr:uncharacterized protein M406DRAFT_291160 [Cryphonectria parasitica EP155]KAF3764118.1 hypothetical protein M406DRAFT_291160 [Cryphonectria parasitica EP155]
MSSSLFTHAAAHGLLRNLLRLLIPLSVTLTVYLYLYPFFLTCGFPLPSSAPSQGSSHDGHLAAWLETVKLHLFSADSLPTTTDTSDGPLNRSSSASASDLRVAPFRLLALGDPQLEGDTSIPNAFRDSSFPHLHDFFSHLKSRSDEYPTFRRSTKQAFHDLVDFYFDDIPNTLESIRKRIDLFGNDFYLGHMYRTLNWWTVPTHVTVLGDLLGSQWISDEEFERRGRRYWNRAFKGGQRVPDEAAVWPDKGCHVVTGALGTALYNETWQRRILNVAGNHDIGYAGDLTVDRMDRFERVFGKANYELRFEVPPWALSSAAASTFHDDSAENTQHTTSSSSSFTPGHDGRLIPELRIVVLNDMNLDTPAASSELQINTYKFVNDIINTASSVEHKGHFTVVLTHVPLYKAEGICVDPPYFSFHDEDGSLKEQNQLSAEASSGFLQGIFGLSGDPMAEGNGQGRRGVILNGHDHEGCDIYHFINQSHGESPADREWQTKRWHGATGEGIVGNPSIPGVREITVRSMMGGYGGNAGLLSAWFDEDSWEWKFEYAECALGTQVIWWAVHIVDLITIVTACLYGALSVLPSGKKGQGGTEMNGCVKDPVKI